jgi:glutamate-ammonia-ligase adenylyltransferase
VAVSLAALQSYDDREAETWELMALTRARVVWASRPEAARRTRGAIERALRRQRDPASTRRDVRAMRELMTRERPPSGFWDLKLVPGGLVDVEFAVQLLQLLHASHAGPLRSGTLDALDAMVEADLAPRTVADPLRRAWGAQQALSQLLRVALADDPDPSEEPAPFRARLAKAGGVAGFAALEPRLVRLRAAARKAYERLIADDGKASAARSTTRGATTSLTSEYDE